MKHKLPEPGKRQPKGRSAALERPIPDVYPELDADLARDNLENDLTAADLQDL